MDAGFGEEKLPIPGGRIKVCHLEAAYSETFGYAHSRDQIRMHVHGFFPSICCNDEDDDDDADDDVGLRDEQLTGLGGWFPRKVFVVTQRLPMAKEVFPAHSSY